MTGWRQIRAAAATVLVTGLVVGLAGHAEASKPKAPPKGALLLPAASIKKVGSTTCGKVRGAWLAGRTTKVGKKRYFVTFQSEAAAQLSRAGRLRGKTKVAALKSARRASARAKALNITCSRATASGPSGGTSAQVRFVPLVGARGLSITSSSGRSALARALPSMPRLAHATEAGTLQKVDVAGSSTPAQASGPPVTVSSITVAPGNRVYALLNSYLVTDPEAGYPPRTKLGCNLGQIAAETGNLICIEEFREGLPGVSGVIPTLTSFIAGSVPPAVGADGSIYYTVQISMNPYTCELRRYRDGVKTTLAQTCSNWLRPLADGSVVIVDGENTLLWSDGSTRTVMSGQAPRWISALGDGRFYVGYYRRNSGGPPTEPFSGIYRLDPTTATAAPAGIPDCSSYGISPPYVCSSAGSHSDAVALDDGSTYMLATTETDEFWWAGTQTQQVYRFLAAGQPVRTVITAFDSVRDITAAGSKLILHGVTRSGLVDGHGFSVHDPAGAGSETMIVSPADGYEIFRVRYVRATNEVWFDAFNDATTSYGLGKVDLDVGPSSFTFTRSAKVIDFQLLG